MRDWGIATYGDPCHECGYGWTMSKEEAVAFVSTIPDSYADLLKGTDGSARHADLSWTAGMYVCHVSDNFRIWAERLAGVSLGASSNVSPYDPDVLAKARGYAEISVEGALWSLRRSVIDWCEAVAMASAKGVILVHPDRGEQSVEDVVSTNTHDAWHHRWDIQRSVR